MKCPYCDGEMVPGTALVKGTLLGFLTIGWSYTAVLGATRFVNRPCTQRYICCNRTHYQWMPVKEVECTKPCLSCCCVLERIYRGR